MQSNDKQELLKYNNSKRRAVEDNALMSKIKVLLRWSLLLALLFFPFMFYVPLYFEDGLSKKTGDVRSEQKEEVTTGQWFVKNLSESDYGTVFGWGLNANRSVPLYVVPDNDTTLIVSTHLCSEPLLLLIVVFSALNNSLERETIRETWGNYSSPAYKLTFLLGVTTNSSLQELVERESSQYNDIVQENFIDSYNNLTLKAVMMLKFVKNHCSNVKFIFKSDDDMFTYVPNLLVLVKFLEATNLKNVLIGNLNCYAKPIQEPSNKWYAPRYIFHEKFYPPYVSGTGYLMDRQTAIKLYEAALEIPYFHLEDVFITGLCARKAKIKPKNHSGFAYFSRPLNHCLYIRDRNVISSHRVTMENMRRLWAASNNETSCAGSKNLPLLKFDFWKTLVGKKNKCS